MHPFELTRTLIDIESTSGNEKNAGDYLFNHLSTLGWNTTRIPVETERFNVYATAAELPVVVLSTHIDTVPPFFPSSEDGQNIYGRGACDTKGIIAAMITAAERLRSENAPVALLFVVGEERDSQGARVANNRAPGSKFLINGEPTENKVAIASKGTLRVELTAEGKMAHSAYPHLGESAIEKLLDALAQVRALKLPENPEIGPTTMNIGIIEGGRAPNVIPDHAKAQLLFRLVGAADELKQDIVQAVGSLAHVHFALEIPFVRTRSFAGLPTMTAAYTTDIPALSKWGEPILFGPGSIHVAHTTGEYINKRELLDAVEIYYMMAKQLLAEE
jgi:acetylornithine deacetylase